MLLFKSYLYLQQYALAQLHGFWYVINDITQHCVITLHYIALHCITLHYIALHCITLHYIALHCITLHYIALHCITLHYIALHCITLHYIALHCITLHYIALHYITLQYITLHYITLHVSLSLYAKSPRRSVREYFGSFEGQLVSMRILSPTPRNIT